MNYGHDLPAASYDMHNEQSRAQPHREAQQQQFMDYRSRRRYPPISMGRHPSLRVPATRRPSQEDIAQMSRSQLTYLYKHRTTQTQSLMGVLRNYKVIAADTLDYSTGSKKSVFPEIDTLNSEIAASLRRITSTDTQKFAVSMTPRPQNDKQKIVAPAPERPLTGTREVAAPMTESPMISTRNVTAFLTRK